SGTLMTVALFFRTMAGCKNEEDIVLPPSSVFISIQGVGRFWDGPHIEISKESRMQVEYSVKSSGEGKELILSASADNEYPESAAIGSLQDSRLVAVRLLVKDQRDRKSSHD